MYYFLVVYVFLISSFLMSCIFPRDDFELSPFEDPSITKPNPTSKKTPEKKSSDSPVQKDNVAPPVQPVAQQAPVVVPKEVVKPPAPIVVPPPVAPKKEVVVQQPKIVVVPPAVPKVVKPALAQVPVLVPAQKVAEEVIDFFNPGDSYKVSEGDVRKSKDLYMKYISSNSGDGDSEDFSIESFMKSFLPYHIQLDEARIDILGKTGVHVVKLDLYSIKRIPEDSFGDDPVYIAGTVTIKNNSEDTINLTFGTLVDSGDTKYYDYRVQFNEDEIGKPQYGKLTVSYGSAKNNPKIYVFDNGLNPKEKEELRKLKLFNIQ